MNARAALAALLLSGALAGPARAQAGGAALALQNPGAVHAIVVGVDGYRNLAPLRGAVADARDIETSLRGLGVKDVVALYDDAADRESILQAAFGLSARVGRGDLVILTVAGHGAQEPERVRGSEADGKDAVFLLAGFAPSGPGTRQRILDKEFNHLIKIFESRGARVVFVADACSGGGLAREVDPRGGDLVYRSAPTYVVTDDELKPVSTPADAYATELDFKRSIFLAAVDKSSKAPEIRVPGVDGWRGALSYGFARALEGAADADGDGRITVDELFSYVRAEAYQLSNQRQTIVSASAPEVRPKTEPVVELTRAVTFVAPPQSARPAPASVSGEKSALTLAAEKPLRIAGIGGGEGALAGLAPREARFEVVTPRQTPELLWDARTGDVVSEGDVVAQEIARDDLPSVIDRAAAVRAIKRMSTHALQRISLSPDGRLYRRGAQLEVVVDDLAGRSLILFNLAGDGTVQLIHPRSDAEAEPLEGPQFRLAVRARAPFGADQMIAISSNEPMPALRDALRRLNARRAAAEVVRAVAQNARPDMRVGSVGVFTAP
ncbi:caspase domain-containing protein [Methylocella sp.]|uniref:caspase domain-containing protein n=1 Tax=Methylocella sp. TaxID=1978226 RepID=UPI00378471DF